MKKIVHTSVSSGRIAAFAATLAAALAGMLATSCVTDYIDEPKTGGGDGQTTTMQFTVAVPDAATAHTTTRAAGPDTEIRNILLLVFKSYGKGDLLERVKAEDIAFLSADGTGAARYQFKARLRVSPEPRDIAFIANALDDHGDQRTNLDEVLAQLYNRKSGSGWENDCLGDEIFARLASKTPVTGKPWPLLMYGRLALPGGLSSHQTTPIDLLRCTAAIDVKVAPQTSDNGLKKFEINRFSVQNAAVRGTIAHNLTWGQGTRMDGITLTTDIPGHKNIPDTEFANHFTFDGGGYWSGKGELHYLYEGPLDKTYVILGAKWNGTPYFYKVEMKNPAGSADIVRNHRYIITITGVSQPGYATLAEAVVGNPSTDAISAHFDAQEEMVSFVSWGDGYLGVSCNRLKFLRGKRGTETKIENIMKCCTTDNYDLTSTWNKTILQEGGDIFYPIPGSPEGKYFGSISGRLCAATNGAPDGIHYNLRISAVRKSDPTISVSKDIPVEVRTLNVDGTPTMPGNNNYQYRDLNALGLLPSHGPWTMEILKGSRNAFLVLAKNGNPIGNYSSLPEAPNDSSSNWGTRGVTKISCPGSAFDSVWLVYSSTDKGFNGTINVSYMEGDKVIVERWLLDGKGFPVLEVDF